MHASNPCQQHHHRAEERQCPRGPTRGASNRDRRHRAPGSTPDIAPAVAGSTGSTTIQTNTAQFLSADIIGTTDIWATTNNRNLTAGSFFDQDRANSAAKVVVLGPSVTRALFGRDPSAALNQTVQINHALFQVIGVMASYGQQQDNTAVMRLNTARRSSSASASAAPAPNSTKSPCKPFDRLTSPQPWQRSPESSTFATTSLTPECRTSKFNPKNLDCKASTRSLKFSSCSPQPRRPRTVPPGIHCPRQPQWSPRRGSGDRAIELGRLIAPAVDPASGALANFTCLIRPSLGGLHDQSRDRAHHRPLPGLSRRQPTPHRGPPISITHCGGAADRGDLPALPDLHRRGGARRCH
jgi:hypothetical protein